MIVHYARSAVLFVVVLLHFVPMRVYATDRVKVEEKLEEGVKLERNGFLNGALSIYDHARRIGPMDFEAHRKYSLLMGFVGKKAEVLEEYNRLATMEEASPAILSVAALLNRDDLFLMKSLAQRAMLKDDSDHWVGIVWALANVRSRQQSTREEAIDLIEKIAEQKNAPAAARLFLAEQFAKEERYPEAIAEILLATKIEEKNWPVAKAMHGDFLVRMGKDSRGIELLENLVKEYPFFALANYLLAEAMVKKEGMMNDVSLNHYRVALLYDKSNPIYMNNFAWRLIYNNDTDFGVENCITFSLSAVLETRRMNIGYLDTLAHCYKARGEHNRATEIANEGLQRSNGVEKNGFLNFLKELKNSGK